MKSFKSFIFEAKNLHMEHLEDFIFLNGIKGAKGALNVVRDIRNSLAGHASNPSNLSIKYDGAPSIFAGKDPRDGKFFVAKKSIFNKNPKIYKTVEEIKDDTSGDLQKKFIYALEYLQPVFNRFNGVVQGDFMFSKNDIKKIKHENKYFISFTPNTITYTVPENSDLAKKILKSKIGIVWHTVYTGNSFESMNASFNEHIIAKLNKTNDVWMIDAVYKDLSGNATFTKKETKEITEILSDIGKTFQKINSSALNEISEDDILKQHILTYNNKHIRDGQSISNTRKYVRGLIRYIHEKYRNEIETRKTEKGKQGQKEKLKTALRFFEDSSYHYELENIFEMYNLFIKAKLLIIKKLNNISSLNALIKTDSGFKVTDQEGFVAIDHIGNAVKLVDRLNFSFYNFNNPRFKK